MGLHSSAGMAIQYGFEKGRRDWKVRLAMLASPVESTRNPDNHIETASVSAKYQAGRSVPPYLRRNGSFTAPVPKAASSKRSFLMYSLRCTLLTRSSTVTSRSPWSSDSRVVCGLGESVASAGGGADVSSSVVFLLLLLSSGAVRSRPRFFSACCAPAAPGSRSSANAIAVVRIKRKRLLVGVRRTAGILMLASNGQQSFV